MWRSVFRGEAEVTLSRPSIWSDILLSKNSVQVLHHALFSGVSARKFDTGKPNRPWCSSSCFFWGSEQRGHGPNETQAAYGHGLNNWCRPPRKRAMRHPACSGGSNLNTTTQGRVSGRHGDTRALQQACRRKFVPVYGKVRIASSPAVRARAVNRHTTQTRYLRQCLDPRRTTEANKARPPKQVVVEPGIR